MILLNSTRTALYHVLKLHYNEFHKKKILVPSFTCHTVTDIKSKANIKFECYELSENFKIDFHKIDKQIQSNNFFGIIGTNYFGFPYFINEFLDICNRHGMLYFEDNSHGLGSSLNNSSLGTFGDFGFTSLTKHIRLQSGGILNIKSNSNLSKVIYDSDLKREKTKFFKIISFYLNHYLPVLTRILINFKSKKLIFNDPYLYKDNYFSYSKIDIFSEIIFKKYDIKFLKEIKSKNYKFWVKEIYKNFEYKPLFEIQENVNPWCVPYLIEDNKIKNEIIKFVKKKNGTCFTWPSLPNKIIYESHNTLNLWKRLLCISTMNK